MLVRAFCLRHLGVRLPKEHIRRQSPMVGNLRYEASYYGGKDGNGAYACLLMPVSGSTEPDVQLYHAKIIKVETRGILIQGQEHVWRRKERTIYPQTLWCWPVHPDWINSQDTDPLDLEDEQFALAR